MKQSTVVTLVAAGLALTSISAAFAAAPDPTRNREKKILVDFESNVKASSGLGDNRVSINSDAQYVGEGSKSLKLDVSGVNWWNDNALVIEFPQPIDISGYQVLGMDVFLPLDSLNGGDNSGTWWQFTPHLTLTNREDDTATSESWLGMRNMTAGWNHLIFNLAEGTDTKISKLTLVVNDNGDKSWTGPIYIDKIQVYKGNFVGLQPDEKLITGFDDAKLKASFDGTAPVDINIDKQYIQSGTGSLSLDLSGGGGGWTTDTSRANDLGLDVDVSNATAIHLDLFAPQASLPSLDGWKELGYVVVGENGDKWGFSSGFLPNQWQTMEIPLTPDEAKTLGHVKGIFFIRNQGANSGGDNPWLGKVYFDNLRAVVPNP